MPVESQLVLVDTQMERSPRASSGRQPEQKKVSCAHKNSPSSHHTPNTPSQTGYLFRIKFPIFPSGMFQPLHHSSTSRVCRTVIHPAQLYVFAQSRKLTNSFYIHIHFHSSAETNDSFPPVSCLTEPSLLRQR